MQAEQMREQERMQEHEEFYHRQSQEQEELHFATISVLRKVALYLDDAEMALLRWHCGINRKELE